VHTHHPVVESGDTTRDIYPWSVLERDRKDGLASVSSVKCAVNGYEPELDMTEEIQTLHKLRLLQQQ
jgi:hypothetical protein